jgi:transposase
MSQEKYIGMDVHQATISVAVMDADGKLIMECLLETKAATIVEFIRGLHGTLSLTFEEGTSAAWLHDLLQPHVSRLVVCDPRKNALLKEGSKSDRIDARKLAELNNPDAYGFGDPTQIGTMPSRHKVRRANVVLSC